MVKQNIKSEATASSTNLWQHMRQRAEERSLNKSELSAEGLSALSLEAIQQMVHELNVRQIQLEMQNEELYRAQVELDDSRTRYFDLYDLAPVGYCTLSEKGMITEANLTAASLLETDRENFKGAFITRFIYREDQELYYRHRKKLYETGLPQTFEIRMVKTGGAIFWTNVEMIITESADGTVVCRIVLSDISERRQSQDTLKESEERYKSLFEYSGVAIVYYGTDGTVISCNQKAAEHMGGNPEDFEGKSLYEIFTGDIAGLYMDRISKAVASEDPQEYEDVRVLKSGSKWFFNTISRIKSLDGKIIGVQIVSQDITRRKSSERELILAKETAENATLAKSQFLATMSHEIRTPLNGVMGTLQVLQMTDLTEDQKRILAVSKTSSEILLAVLNDILDYSKIEAGRMELEETSFSLRKVVEEAGGVFQLAAMEKGLATETFISSDIPNILVGDPFRLRQILSNLIGNAVKYTAEGRIDVLAEKINDVDHQRLLLKFMIKDTGIGIPADHISQLFESFTQVDNSNTREFGGTGLGLAISKNLVELMGGEIWVESQVGVGSSFCFTCLLGKIEEENHSAYKLYGGELKEKREKELRVLLVEDDLISRMVIEKFAEGKDWEIAYAMNGQEAIKLLERMRFDVILMDVQMPVMDGIEATRIIRRMENSKDTPIIALTAYALKGDRNKCVEAGMNDYLAKPIDSDEFYAIVQKWARWKAELKQGRNHDHRP